MTNFRAASKSYELTLKKTPRWPLLSLERATFSSLRPEKLKILGPESLIYYYFRVVGPNIYKQRKIFGQTPIFGGPNVGGVSSQPKISVYPVLNKTFDSVVASFVLFHEAVIRSTCSSRAKTQACSTLWQHTTLSSFCTQFMQYLKVDFL